MAPLLPSLKRPGGSTWPGVAQGARVRASERAGPRPAPQPLAPAYPALAPVLGKEFSGGWGEKGLPASHSTTLPAARRSGDPDRMLLVRRVKQTTGSQPGSRWHELLHLSFWALSAGLCGRCTGVAVPLRVVWPRVPQPPGGAAARHHLVPGIQGSLPMAQRGAKATLTRAHNGVSHLDKTWGSISVRGSSALP